MGELQQAVEEKVKKPSPKKPQKADNDSDYNFSDEASEVIVEEYSELERVKDIHKF